MNNPIYVQDVISKPSEDYELEERYHEMTLDFIKKLEKYFHQDKERKNGSNND
jgi:hypothetical protein